MPIRHKRLGPGDTAWLDCHHPYERKDLVNNARVRVLEYRQQEMAYRIRIEEGPQSGLEVQVLHWSLVHFEYQFDINDTWYDESDPVVLTRLARELSTLLEKGVSREQDPSIDHVQRLLARHRWKVPSMV